MTTTQLSDGSAGTVVQLSLPIAQSGCAALGNTMWMLTKGSATITLRNVRTGEVSNKIDLLEEGTAIASVGNRIWVATVSNKVYVISHEGTLLGALQSSGLPTIRRFFVLAPDVVFSSSGGKDLSKWDTTQFNVERTFYGSVPGEVICDVTPANSTISSIIVATSVALRCYSIDGGCLAESTEAAAAVCVLSPRMMAENSASILLPSRGAEEDQALIWAAQTGWITIFSLASTMRASHFVREKTVPCANVKQMFLTGNRVVTFDGEGLVTVWEPTAGSPLRSFKTTSVIGVSSGPTSFSVPAARIKSTAIWSVGDGRALIWTDDEIDENGRDQAFDHLKDLEREEIQFLRKKMMYLESIGKLYREKVRGLVSTRSVPVHQATHVFNEIDSLYEKALVAWKNENDTQEPLPSGEFSPSGKKGGDDNGDFTEYWKHKYHDALSQLDSLKREHDNMVALLHDKQNSPNELEVRRAHHICEVIKEKNELRERERQLSEDVAKLRARLREYNSPLASRGPPEDIEAIKEQNTTLRDEVAKLRSQIEQDRSASNEVRHAVKHNQILKQRVRKLRADLDAAQLQLSEAAVANQHDIEQLVDTVAQLQANLDMQKTKTTSADQAKALAAIRVAEQSAEVERLRSLLESTERDLQQRDAVERAAQVEVRNEITMLCQSLDDRDKRIADQQSALNEANAIVRQRNNEVAAIKADLEAKNAEVTVLQSRVDQLEGIVADRKQYARTVGELQGRMEMAVEELRMTFTPVQFAENIESLETRMANLTALEAQLRQKDDIIAMRDDQINHLRQHMLEVDKQIQQVSSVFLHLPKSVEEVELLMVEVDEYRRRLGMDTETQELIQIRLLEIQAKRKAGEPIPALLDIGKEISSPGRQRTQGELERLKQLTEAMAAVAKSVAKEDKTGLVETPAPSAKTAPAEPSAQTTTAAPPPAAATRPASKTVVKTPTPAPVGKKP